MNCGQTEKKLVAYLDGKLAMAARRQMEAHLAICARVPGARRGIPLGLGRAR